MKTEQKPQELIGEVIAGFRTVAAIAEEARLSVNDIGVCLRQVDIDATSAATRGLCMSIIAICKDHAARLQDFINRNQIEAFSTDAEWARQSGKTVPRPSE